MSLYRSPELLASCMVSEMIFKTAKDRQFGPQEYGWQDLCKRPLDIATY